MTWDGATELFLSEFGVIIITGKNWNHLEKFGILNIIASRKS